MLKLSEAWLATPASSAAALELTLGVGEDIGKILAGVARLANAASADIMLDMLLNQVQLLKIHDP
jgi:hypothetical protein